jgi:TolA-binding protein
MEDPLKLPLIPLVGLIFFSSCSWHKGADGSSSDQENNTNNARSVSKDQYEQLLIKYEELSKKYESLKDKNSQDEGQSLVDEIQKGQSENFARVSPNVQSETVNVFQEPAKSNAPSVEVPLEVPKDINAQLELYRQGLEAKNGRSAEALKIFQLLSAGAQRPILIRSKFQTGEILLAQGQTDLALQTFEDIIFKHSDSGVVLEALKGAQVASDKLGITAKKDQYASMINDVFGR